MIFLRSFLSVLLLSFFWNVSFGQTTLLTDAGTTYNNTDAVTTDNYGPVDISGCATVTFSVDYNFSDPWEGSGNMESADECNSFDPCLGDTNDPAGGGCNMCWDFLLVDFLIGGSQVGGDLIGDAGTTDAEQSGTISLDYCNDMGATTAQMDIFTQTWASSESVTFSNISIVCYETAPTASVDPTTVCPREFFTLTAVVGDPSSVNSIQWNGTGSVDNPNALETIANTQVSGPVTFTIETTDPLLCETQDDVTVNVLPAAFITPPSPLIICYSLIPPAGEILNLDDVIDEITNFDPTQTVNFYFDIMGNNPLDPFSLSDLLTLVNNGQTTIYASTTNSASGCESNIVPVSIDLNEYPDASDGMLMACLGTNGVATFDPSDADDQITGGDNSLSVSYHSNPTDAENGDNPITGIVTTPTDLTIYAGVQNGAGCITVVELELMVGSGVVAEDATLEVCDDGSGQGTFDLTEAESTILNGQSGTVIFYEDSGLNNEILNPTNYSSGPAIIYAVIDDGAGCVSDPAEVTLLLISIDPADVFLSFNPDSGCGNTVVEMTLNTPASPPGDYTFNVNFGPQSTGPVSNGDFIGTDGETPFIIGVNETYVFVLNSVTGPGPDFCPINLPMPIEYIIPINDAPDAFPASITACGNEFGEGIFDLTLLENTINGFSGDPVDFFEDIGLNSPINNPGSYVSGPATIYAVVDAGGGCVSDPVEVTLLIEEAPDPVDFTLDITSSCDPETVTLTFSLPNGDAYDFDLLITDAGGTTVSTYNGITNFSQLSFAVTETTTFSIDEITSSFGCTYTLNPGPSATITIGAGPTPNEASLEACDDGTGQATFDLTQADDTVNGNSGETVVWFSDPAGNNPINNPSNFTSASGTVYAAIDAGGCVSPTAEVTLTVLDLPEVNINLDNPLDCDGDTNGSISVTVTGPTPYSFDWNDNTYDGQQVLTGLSAGFYALTLTDGNGCEAFADIDLSAPPALNLFCSVVNDETAAGANDGAVSFDINGGTPLYSADLSGPTTASLTNLAPNAYVFTNLSPGDYVITITDANGCITDCIFTIEASVCALNFTLDPTDVSCNGEDDGSISVTINDGVPAYSYDWSDDQYDGLDQLDNLAPGNYTLTITDMSGCTFEQTATIDEPTELVLDCRANMMGQGSGPGSYTFTYSGGTPFYLLDLTGPVNISFSENNPGTWDTAVLPPGNYTFVLTDENNCSQSCSFVIDPVCDLSLLLTGSDPLCPGSADGILDLQITSSQPITAIDWNEDTLDGETTANNLVAGTYTVTVVDQLGCVETASITLTDPAAYDFDCVATNLPSGPGATDGSLTITVNDGPGGPYTVSYDDGNGTAGTIPENTLPPNSFTQDNLPSGIYQISITNPAGCSTNCSVDLQVPSCPLTLNQNGTPPTCSDSNDASVTVTPTDGTPNYTYDWNDDAFDGMATASGLAAGTTLSVTVTDAVGCVGTLNFLVPTPPAIVLDCSVITDPSNAGTNDGSIDLAVSGGSAPYTISWTGPSNGSGSLANAGNFLIDNLGIGDYTITVADANGCTSSCVATLSAPSCDLVLDLQGTNPVCANSATGSLDLFIDSSAPIVSIDWNFDAFDGVEDPMNVAAGTYEVTVTDMAGCEATTSLTLVDPPAIFVDCSQLTHPTTPAGTNGGVDVVLAGGNPPYTINWDGPVTGMGTANTAGVFPITGLSVGAYTITVEDSNGCQEFCGFVMINNENCNFSIVLSGTDPSCNGDTDGTINFQLIEGTPNFTFSWNDSSLDSQGPSGNQTDLGAGFYSVTVTDASNCIASETFTLNEPAAIIFSCAATTQPSDGTASDGVITVDFTSGPGGPYTLTYDNGAGTTGSLPITPGITTIDNLPVGDYTITITDGNCSEECSASLVDNSCTFALNMTSTDEQCVGAVDGTATATASGGTMPYTYAWSNLEDTPTITGLTPADYTVTVTDAAGCVATATVTINGGQPNPTLAAGPGASICADSCYLLPLNFGGTGPFDLTYQLDFGGSTTNLQQSFSQAQDSLLLCPASEGIPAGNFAVIITQLTDTNCTTSLADTVFFTYLSPATGTLATTLCSTDSITIAGTTFNFANPSGQVVLAGGASSGCDSTVTVNLNFFPPSTSFFEDNICPGDTIGIGGEQFFVGNSSGIIVLENASSNGCDSTITVSLTELTPGSNNFTADLCAGDTLLIAGEVFDENRLVDTVTLPNQAANGCDSLITVNLSLIPLIPNMITTLLCPGDSLLVGDSVLVNPGSYGILLPDAASSGCDSLVQVDLNFFAPATGLLEGTFCGGEEVMVGDSLFNAAHPSGTVLLPGASSNGCDSILTVDLQFLPGSLSNLDTLLCFGESLTLGNQTFDAQNNSGIVVLENAAANGCDSTILVNTSFRPELFASVGPDTTLCGDQTLDAEVTLSEGDSYEFSVQITPGPLLNVEDVAAGVYTFSLGTVNSDITLNLTQVISNSGCPVTITDDQALIRYSDSQLTLTSVGGNGTSDVSCADLADGSVSVDIQGGIGPFSYAWNTGATGAVINDLAPGTYTVTVTDAPGCSVEAALSLTAPTPLATTAAGASAGCFGSNTGTISIDTITGGTGPYEYSLDDEFYTGISSFPALIPDLLAGNYTVYVRDANDCLSTISVGVPEGQQLQLELGDDETIQLGDSILLDPIFDFTPTSWTWTPREGLSQPDTFVTYAAPTETTLYQLVMADANGCTVSDQLRIFVEQDINVFIPSAFSPNGDGSNDRLMIFAGQSVTEIESFQIFDRWGNQVFVTGPFQPNDPLYGWDGKLNGEVMNAAVFVYFARVRLVTGEVVLLEGDVVLLR